MTCARAPFSRLAWLSGCAAALLAASPGLTAEAPRESVRSGMVLVPAGSYRPLYMPPAKPGRSPAPAATPPRVRVPAFRMDQHAVTNAQFLAFVTEHPEWRRSRVKPLFADEAYLRHWTGDLELGPGAPPESPVVNVSWFAARAYLRAAGKALPSVDQWEYAASASESKRDASRDRPFLNRLLAWYAERTPVPVPRVGSGFGNVYGAGDLHGLVWEWTLDFNSALVTGESRADSDLERMLFCGSGAAAASDFENYAAFMRYAFRSSLEARYNVANLGFRGVAAADAATPSPR